MIITPLKYNASSVPPIKADTYGLENKSLSTDFISNDLILHDSTELFIEIG